MFSHFSFQKAAERNPFGFISSIDTTTIRVSNDVKNGNLPSSTRMGNIINGRGKGFTVYGGSSAGGYILLELDNRGSSSKENIWSYNAPSLGSGNRHLCNGFGKCATSVKTNVLANKGTLNWDQIGWNKIKHWNPSDEESQKFYFLDSLTHPGFYVIKDAFGKCIGVPENTDKNGAEIRACYCNSSEATQRWKWHYY